MDSDKVVTANFAPVGITLIGAIKQNPVVYEGQTVTISGEYRGWEGGHGSPPVTRSDWVVQDNTGSIYITGSSLGLRYPDDLGKVIKVNGIVKLKNGQPYIYIARNSPVEGFTEFYILPSGSGDFPREVTLGESGKVIVGIVNHEHEVAVYKVEIVIDAEKVGEMAPVTLIDGEKFEQEADFTPIRAGLNQKVEFLLYEGATTEPYLKLYLFVDVKEAP
jgi:hypothetical protein